MFYFLLGFYLLFVFFFFFSIRRRHTRLVSDWSSDVCSSDLSPVVVENRPGADSAIAAEYVSRQAPDGYTLCFCSNSAMTAAVALKKAPLYDPLKAFTPLGLVGRATFFFYSNPEVPAKKLQEFIAHARVNPGKLNYGTGNPLSILAMVQLMNAANITMVQVPYKGEGPLTPDLIAGRVQSSFLSNPAGIQ